MKTYIDDIEFHSEIVQTWRQVKNKLKKVKIQQHKCIDLFTSKTKKENPSSIHNFIFLDQNQMNVKLNLYSYIYTHTLNTH
jgi:effector-binding domain-containing protein